MSGGEAGPAEGLDRQAVRAALGEELAGLEEVSGLLEQVSADVRRLEGSLPERAPDEDQRRQVVATIADRLAVLRSRVRESRDRLDGWIDRLRDARDPAVEDLERLRGVLECIVKDQLEPARTALQNLLDEILPGEVA